MRFLFSDPTTPTTHFPLQLLPSPPYNSYHVPLQLLSSLLQLLLFPPTTPTILPPRTPSISPTAPTISP